LNFEGFQIFIIKSKTEIDKIDQKAFLVMSKVKDIKGGMIKKLPLKKLKNLK